MEKSFPSISIIGMAGSGKTEIGKRLASIFDFDFFDTDQIIEKHFNKSLQSILEEVGYLELRQIEQSTYQRYAVKKLCSCNRWECNLW